MLKFWPTKQLFEGNLTNNEKPSLDLIHETDKKYQYMYIHIHSRLRWHPSPQHPPRWSAPAESLQRQHAPPNKLGEGSVYPTRQRGDLEQSLLLKMQFWTHSPAYSCHGRRTRDPGTKTRLLHFPHEPLRWVRHSPAEPPVKNTWENILETNMWSISANTLATISEWLFLFPSCTHWHNITHMRVRSALFYFDNCNHKHPKQYLVWIVIERIPRHYMHIHLRRPPSASIALPHFRYLPRAAKLCHPWQTNTKNLRNFPKMMWYSIADCWSYIFVNPIHIGSGLQQDGQGVDLLKVSCKHRSCPILQNRF